jgi:pyruvate/2-oxoglutarate dehydrogenase complex dihydrolipoamide dehydrogenase (E3) component/uncharacterized membrane protein YdjX (TVP38/TMEM64 family)
VTGRRLFLVAALVALVVAFFASDLPSLLTIPRLKAQLGPLLAWRDASPLAAAAALFGVYVLVTAVSLPGAAVLTLAAGALFGVARGTLLVSFASTIGATLAFLVARHLVRDLVQARFGDRLRKLDEGLARDGAFYLFTLRLVPLFPFWLVNLLMGLGPVRTRTFYWVSQLGMLPGTLVYVNAGTRLAAIEGPRDILSPPLLLSFVALGLFPLLARRVATLLQRRRIYARWRRPSAFDRNLVVIGAGAAGLVTSYVAAAVKARVTLVESGRMGGDCLNYGCVPSKALIRSARLAHQMRHADRYGLQQATPGLRFRDVLARVKAVIDDVAPHDSVERYTGLGVEVLQGHATIVDPWTVEVAFPDGRRQRLTTRHIVIAAGARPAVPDIPGIEDSGYVTSDTVWDEFARRDTPPRELVVLGGGPIGCELAQAFARLGCGVTQVERGQRLLAREDDEVSAAAESALRADGVVLLAGTTALRCEREEQDGVVRRHLVIEQDGTERRLPFDALLCATGRVARLTGYGLEELGVDTARTVATNEFLETSIPNILAAGDVAGPFQFTHVAGHQGWHAAVNALFGDVWRFKVDYRVIPRTTFIDPDIACVGLNEREAREKGVAFEVTRFEMADLDRAIADGATDGFIKVLTVPGKDRVLGVTIVGEHAGELLAEYVLAMKHGIGLNKLLGTVHAYPTLTELNKSVAGEWKRAHAPQRALAWLARYHRWRRK